MMTSAQIQKLHSLRTKNYWLNCAVSVNKYVYMPTRRTEKQTYMYVIMINQNGQKTSRHVSKQVVCPPFFTNRVPYIIQYYNNSGRKNRIPKPATPVQSKRGFYETPWSFIMLSRRVLLCKDIRQYLLT